MRAPLWSLVFAVAACVDDPSMTNPLSISASEVTAAADGASVVTLTVVADTDDVVTLTASTGSFVNAAPVAAGMPATTTVMTARGSATVSYRTGLDTGIAVIAGSAGAFSATQQLTLTPSVPTELAIEPDRTTVTGDGVSAVMVTATATAVLPALVSNGTPVTFAVCCLDGSGAPATCNGQAPLFVPARATIEAGSAVTVQAITSKVTAATSALLVASATGSAASCTSTSGNLNAAVEVDVTP